MVHMGRRATMVPVDELTKAAREFEHNRTIEQDAAKKKNKARDLVKGWLTQRDALGRLVNGRTDENGHRFFDLPDFSVVAQRKTSSSIDTDAVELLLRRKDETGSLYDRVFKRVVIREFDEDELYLLNQQGIISDAELDELIDESESYSLTIANPQTL